MNQNLTIPHSNLVLADYVIKADDRIGLDEQARATPGTSLTDMVATFTPRSGLGEDRP